MIEVFLIIVISLIFVIILRRVVSVKLDPSDSVLAMHANAMAEVADESGANKKIEVHINHLMNQAKDSLKNEQFSFAEKVLIRVATLDPKNLETYRLLGDLYLRQQNYKDAISSYKVALRYQPKDAQILHNLGLCYYQENQYKRSIKYFKKSVRYESGVAHRYISIASAYQSLKDMKNAKIYMKKALDLEPANIAYQKLYQELK